ncbi:AMP-binding protein [Roseibium salinum]|uniref:AMP-binding protein n=1 Tax=Roseibium salinum TaxID=1604349 RepID=A0ABT3R375_9HYPH|nr:AMP-binding protein [Roseibium sp. DSM 29163]MCX2723521.1 AMP-binding protein [Roseibium sp. DSM 29163]
MSNHLFDALTAYIPDPDKMFLETADGTGLSYREMLARSAQYAGALHKLGVKPGDRVAAQVEKSPDALMLYLGTIRAGGVFLPLNTAYTPAEVGYFVGDAEPSVFVCDPARADALAGVAQKAGAKLQTLDADGRGGLSELADTMPGQYGNRARAAEDLAAILYTSGTTGRSKGAMLSHDNLASNPYDGERRPGTVGFALPGVGLRIVDSRTGREVPRGEVGIIEVKGSNVFQGYWRMPEKTAQEFRVDGYFITGDMGRVDEDGYVSIVGRSKDLIISGGFNVYPAEVEALLDEVPGVAESAVIGVPHADFGEAVVAVLAAKPGAAIDEETVQASLADRLARFKQPKKVHVLDTLPRNAMGKIQKNVLRDQFKHDFA